MRGSRDSPLDLGRLLFLELCLKFLDGLLFLGLLHSILPLFCLEACGEKRTSAEAGVSVRLDRHGEGGRYTVADLGAFHALPETRPAVDWASGRGAGCWVSVGAGGDMFDAERGRVRAGGGGRDMVAVISENETGGGGATVAEI